MTVSTGARKAQWNDTFKRAEEFFEQHGKMPRSTCDDPDEAFLGKWLTRQRRKRAAGRLSPERQKRLDGIGALAPSNEPEFIEKLEACAAFIERHGRTPSSTATDPEEKSLYYWRAGQQHLRSIGKLKPHRLQILEERGIFQTAFEHEWRSFFERLQRFVKENGRPPIRFSDNPEEASLGQWRQQQFALYKKGEMDKERARMLESLGIATTVTNINWNNSFRQLEAFVKARSTLPSRFSDNEDEKQLARWLETQRQLIKSNDQPPRRRRLIDSLELPENRLEDRWDKTLKEVQTFVTSHGRLPSTNAKARKERSLAIWCYRQRTELKAGTLKPERTQPVEELGVHLDRKREQWKSRYKQVYLFIREHGRQPKHHSIDPEERTLGRWCEHQRYLHSQGKQSKERISVLRSARLLK